MKTLKRILFAAAAVSGTVSLVAYIVPRVIGRLYFKDVSSASAIGIIGGADGPTAVFLSKAPSYIFIAPVIFALSFLLWLILSIIGREKE